MTALAACPRLLSWECPSVRSLAQSFLQSALGPSEPVDRVWGTRRRSHSIWLGDHIVRVHDVKPMVDVVVDRCPRQHLKLNAEPRTYLIL